MESGEIVARMFESSKLQPQRKQSSLKSRMTEGRRVEDTARKYGHLTVNKQVEKVQRKVLLEYRKEDCWTISWLTTTTNRKDF